MAEPTRVRLPSVRTLESQLQHAGDFVHLAVFPPAKDVTTDPTFCGEAPAGVWHRVKDAGQPICPDCARKGRPR